MRFVYMHEQTVSCLQTEQMWIEDQMTDDNNELSSLPLKLEKN